MSQDTLGLDRNSIAAAANLIAFGGAPSEVNQLNHWADRFTTGASTDATRKGDEIVAFLSDSIGELGNRRREAFVRQIVAEEVSTRLLKWLDARVAIPTSETTWLRSVLESCRMPHEMPTRRDPFFDGPNAAFWQIAWRLDCWFPKILKGDFGWLDFKAAEHPSGGAMADALILAVAPICINERVRMTVSDCSVVNNRWCEFLAGWHEWRIGTDSMPLEYPNGGRKSAREHLAFLPCFREAQLRRLVGTVPELARDLGAEFVPYESEWNLHRYLTGVAAAWASDFAVQQSQLIASYRKGNDAPVESYLASLASRLRRVDGEPSTSSLRLSQVEGMRTLPLPSVDAVRAFVVPLRVHLERKRAGRSS
ncbi:MAG: hypothetical protein IT290_02310 [Deltaproteobacteria bacterium]|nr:hypothetical protein [Deltaproteobacteria bacterium]